MLIYFPIIVEYTLSLCYYNTINLMSGKWLFPMTSSLWIRGGYFHEEKVISNDCDSCGSCLFGFCRYLCFWWVRCSVCCFCWGFFCSGRCWYCRIWCPWDCRFWFCPGFCCCRCCDSRCPGCTYWCHPFPKWTVSHLSLPAWERPE